MLKKIGVGFILLTIITAIYLFNRSEFQYASIPHGFFDDKDRIIVKNDQYIVLKEYLNSTYQNIITDKKYEIIGTGKQKDALMLEQYYLTNEVFINLAIIFGTGNRGNISGFDNIESYMSDIPKKVSLITDDLLIIAQYHCKKDTSQDLCSLYTSFLGNFIIRLDRRGGFVSELTRLGIISKLQKAGISLDVNQKLLICQSFQKKIDTHQILKDEVVMAKNILQVMVNEMENIALSEGIGNVDLQTATLTIEKTKKKLETSYFNNYFSNIDNNQYNGWYFLPKLLLGKLGINTPEYLGDILSNLLVISFSSNSKVRNTIKSKLIEFCK